LGNQQEWGLSEIIKVGKLDASISKPITAIADLDASQNSDLPNFSFNTLPFKGV